ncbi:MAG: tetraacyldisaccharide 4'-kinase [Candidatus Aminicenantes bacterium]|nr:tetraacyldisaccharide 4'-kinase [Candidatus Aminicenantes bacterium]
MEILFSFLSLPYQLGSQVKNLCYRWNFFKPKKAPLPIISVGNITFGGSEKTPLVMNLISFLEKQGYKPALVSRGYRGKWERKGGILSDGQRIFGTWEESGDEPYMVAQNYPGAGIFVGKQRLLSCVKAEDLGFEVALLDDGFQHQRLHRDLDIVLYEPAEHTLRREPASALKRAHLILVKRNLKPELKNRIRKSFPRGDVFEYSVIQQGFWKLNSEERLGAEAFRGQKALAFCGLARPERFSTLVKEIGIEIIDYLKFPDHYSYPPSALRKIAHRFSKIKPALAITTEKDAIKIAPEDHILKPFPVYYLKIDLDLEENFYQRITCCLQSLA